MGREGRGNGGEKRWRGDNRGLVGNRNIIVGRGGGMGVMGGGGGG